MALSFERSIEAETAWLSEQGIDLVLTDAEPQPLPAARRLRIPSRVVSNFTWHDIFSKFPGASQRIASLDVLEKAYASADGQLLPQMHIKNQVIDNQQEIGLLSMPGKNIRKSLEASFSQFSNKSILAFIYMGQYGAETVQWERLGRLQDCLFITRDTIPNPPANVIVLDERYRYPDLIASADVVCAKPGYSTLAAAFAHGKPVLTSPRSDFCEYEAIEKFIQDYNVGVVLKSDDFFSCDWQVAIEKALSLDDKKATPLNGEVEAEAILQTLLSR